MSRYGWCPLCCRECYAPLEGWICLVGVVVLLLVVVLSVLGWPL